MKKAAYGGKEGGERCAVCVVQDAEKSPRVIRGDSVGGVGFGGSRAHRQHCSFVQMKSPTTEITNAALAIPSVIQARSSLKVR